MGDVGGYAFDHAWESERVRLGLLEEVFDATTFRHLEVLGVGPGWRCLEVGAGAGSIARWLCRCVGPDGRVVATDVDTGFLDGLAQPGLEVRRHDIVTEDLEEGAFDLIHCRLVLEHLPGRELALKRMVSALAPGGVLVAEEYDMSTLHPAPGPQADLFTRGVSALLDFMETGGYDRFYGRHVVDGLSSAGLEVLGAEGRVVVALPGSTAARWWWLTVERLASGTVARGGLSAEDAERLLALRDDDRFWFHYPLMVTGWGRRLA